VSVAGAASDGASNGIDTTDTGGSETAAVADSDAIRIENALRQVDRPGEYGVRTRVELPDRVTELRLEIPETARDVTGTGFSRESETTWVWDRETSTPRLSYRMPANRTREDAGPLEGEGEYLFVGTGEWAIVRTPAIGARWRQTGDELRVTRENVVSGDGAASDRMAYLGPYEEHVHEAHGQRFRLIVPESAELSESPAEIHASLEHASGALRVGDRDGTVFVIAAPTSEIGWSVRGLQTGPADMWVRDLEGTDTATNVWVHEYVHTRQGYAEAPSGRWITEASASYYAALLTLERGGVDFESFRRVLERGERDPQASSVLSRPDTWRNAAEYTKGALVTGEIDRRMRLATDGQETTATVLRRLNAREDPIENDDVLGYVREAAGREVRDEAERLTTTEAAPTAWDRRAHDEAFGRLPARIAVSLDDPDAVRATGEYRDRAIDRDPATLVPGETLRVRVRVSNVGGTAGEYDLEMRVDGETVAIREGELDANESTVESFEHAFAERGDHEVSVAGDRITVSVVEPATPRVRGLTVDPDRVAAGEPIRVSATVENPESIPAGGEFALSVNGETAETHEVLLDANETTTVESTVTPTDPGEATIAFGEARATVAVDPAATTAGSGPGGTADDGSGAADDGPTDERTPGFLGVHALVALLLAIALVGARVRGTG
jgi:hypothetical protein